MTKEQIIDEIVERIEREKSAVSETKYDIRTPAFNQNLGRFDALTELLTWIEEDE